MKTRIPVVRLAVSLMALSLTCASHAQMRTAGTTIDIEAGLAWQDKNDVQSPNDGGGTRFGLDRVTGSGPFFAPRLQVTTGVAPRHELRFVVAPLSIKESGNLDGAVRFQGQNFAAGGAEAKYRFNSYRATWRYTVFEDRDWTLKVGATAKIRDAEITLRQGGVSATRDNTGFVPLLHVYAERRLDNRSRLTFEGDALAGGPGYAIDVSGRYVRDLGQRWSWFGGVRVLDGGADSSSVYNFARFYYLNAGLQYRL
ncbi:MAG: hypothetical protein JNM79_02570 [Burkholderiales bacterium]|nr:hypothetical protein [Burkholderiales bacterium]